MAVPIRNIVFGCPDGTWNEDHWEGPPRVLAEFYAALLGMRVIREDWLVIAADESTLPRLAFGEGPSDAYVAPRWPDPAFPQQVHLDISVPDLRAAEELVLGLGASRLEDQGLFRTYADPVGHPFDLYTASAGRPFVHRVVFDCPDPAALARFYGELLHLPSTVETPHGVVISGSERDRYPLLAFQRVDDYRPPRWPDPQYPQQLHLDFHVPAGAGLSELAERLGATRLPEMGGSCPVYADPAAHPFCLCSPNE
jgi:catechol 2,3-dioxygenase-like lactoylglutathione lyase family enzyme